MCCFLPHSPDLSNILDSRILLLAAIFSPGCPVPLVSLTSRPPFPASLVDFSSLTYVPVVTVACGPHRTSLSCLYSHLAPPSHLPSLSHAGSLVSPHIPRFSDLSEPWHILFPLLEMLSPHRVSQVASLTHLVSLTVTFLSPLFFASTPFCSLTITTIFSWCSIEILTTRNDLWFIWLFINCLFWKSPEGQGPNRCVWILESLYAWPSLCYLTQSRISVLKRWMSKHKSKQYSTKY